MLYASSLATLKREFGLGHITREFRAASLDEMTLNAYNKHIQTQAAPPPRTMREEEILEIQSREATADISVDSRHPTLQGLFFPFDENVIEALHLFKKHSVNYIQLEIDHEKERILLSHSEAHVTPEKIQKCIPNNEGRYHVYRFIHEFNHIPCEKVLSIYSVPGYNSAIKQRMVYASCKESVIDHIEKKFGVMFDKKIEITEPTELTSEHLLELLHPVEHQVSSKSQFAKPKLPGAGSRGPRRLVKTTDENS
ncbi:unnamed protein product [Didymodactylos carnosus]|uniref:ADF-H domain-containing protein n=1 Tax=Didymodactylos carnosus TaxID=1234261 RepID=A0A813UII9_9BILA|nr:unnamed protein product [Didymodactylos carnosus]CAF0829630.1 unnamed protein product [Didymodactylos carnosus]CAF3564623.1 unnamed protein product [Didymodactylos carnosus]CAF3616664.1 unnamed protein product [Didymodactylos carnosus]